MFVKQRASAVLIQQQTGSHHIKLLALSCPHSVENWPDCRCEAFFFTKHQKRPLPLLKLCPGRVKRGKWSNKGCETGPLLLWSSYFGDLQSQHWDHIAHTAYIRQFSTARPRKEFGRRKWGFLKGQKGCNRVLQNRLKLVV